MSIVSCVLSFWPLIFLLHTHSCDCSFVYYILTAILSSYKYDLSWWFLLSATFILVTLVSLSASVSITCSIATLLSQRIPDIFFDPASILLPTSVSPPITTIQPKHLKVDLADHCFIHLYIQILSFISYSAQVLSLLPLTLMPYSSNIILTFPAC